MKNSLLLFLSLTFTWALNAQVIFSGESPVSIQGSYDMTYTDPGGGWGSPDLIDPTNSVLDTLVQFYDNTAGDSLGCFAAVNGNDVDGHIAVIYRGECEFGTKALNAQDAGAIACVIINNVPGGPVAMGAGADGANVTIPVVMIGDADGAILINEMQSNPVEVFIGNKTGYYANDLGTLKGRYLTAEYSSTPSLLAQDDTEFEVELGAWVYNYGFQNQTEVVLGATVELASNEIYTGVAAPVDIPAGDSVFLTLPNFSQTTYAEGYYELQYTITSDSIDDYEFDNTINSSFLISEDKISYASFDEATMLPNSSGGTRPVDGGGNPIPTYYSCINFMNANASRVAVNGITFAAVKANDAAEPSLEGEPFNISIQEYNDQFTDINDPGFTNPIGSISEIAFEEYAMPTDSPGEAMTAMFDEPILLEDNQRYLFCVTTFNEEVFFGHDPNMDYTLNRSNYLQPLFPIEAGGWNPNGFGPTTVPAVTAHVIDAADVSLQKEKLAIEMNAYPSPASSILNIDFNGYDVDNVQLVNLTGQTVASQRVSKGDVNSSIDVNGLENGVYIVKVNLTNGM
ncbi:MAG: PA domain-containing protein, partial [Brumimicrobium sp.]